MKKTSKILTVLTVCVSMITAISCSNGLTGYTDLNDSSATNHVTISLSNNLSSARTILPAIASDSLVYKITGTSSIGTTLTETTLTVSNSTAEIDLSPAIWDLTLKAYESVSSSDAILVGYATVDLTNGGDSISFILKPTGDGTGSVTINGTFSASDASVSYYRIGMYNANTGAVVTESYYDVSDSGSAASVADTSTLSSDTTASSSGTLAEYTPSVDNGEYNLIITFYGKNDSKYKVIGQYSELVIVVGGGKTTGSITFTDFNSKPTVPDNLSVTNKELNTDQFNAVFTWDDKSNNETGFKITVTDVSDSSSPVTYRVYTKDDANDFSSGSLAANSKTVTIPLLTGRIYTAYIQSENDVGGSSDTDSKAYYGTEASPTSFGRRVITYDLNGGQYVTDASTSYNSYMYEQSDYGTDLAFKAINAYDPTSITYPYAYRTSDCRTTSSWASDDTTVQGYIDSKTYPSAEYKNITVRASYTTPIAIEIYEFSDIDYANRVTYSFTDTSSTTTDSPASISGNGTITVTFNAKQSSSYADSSKNLKNFTSFYVEYGIVSNISKLKTDTYTFTKASTEDNKGSVTIDTTKIYSDGNLHLRVVAYDADSQHWYDGSTVLTISR